MKLSDLKVGQSARIQTVGGSGALRQHFLDMGVIPGTEVTFVKFAPLGDPIELKIHGYELTLRLAEADQIEVEPLSELETLEKEKADKEYVEVEEASYTEIEHPGLGEMGKFHTKKGEHPLPEGTELTFALAGNQNCGKTTLFNQLTGANQHVGNFPGVTVDQKSGPIRNQEHTMVTDLPGIYSLSPYTSEEIVSRQFILNEKPTGIINIVDATNLERNLYLSMQLMELGVPIVLALNMMDEMSGNGGIVDINKMEAMLGIPVVPISAAKNDGIDELVHHAMHVAKYQEAPEIQDLCFNDDETAPVHRAIHATMHLIEDHAKKADIPLRFAATKLLEGDHQVREALNLDKNEYYTIEHIVRQMEDETGLDREAAIANMRYNFIYDLVEQTVKKPKMSKERERSIKIDRFLTGKYTAIPAFVAIMALIFWLTFNVIGAWLQELFEEGIAYVTDITSAALTAAHTNEVLHSLIIDGVFNGVGSVLSFLPIIITLFFFLSLLEDTGYMARVAFVMDKLLRKIGLSGRSIVPLLIGFGCTVPGVMATRTLPSERDRRMTVVLLPFMSCTAKLPIYAFFTAAFFPGHGALIMVGLYFIGIAIAILTALATKNTVFKGDAVPFVMELPNYRMPGMINVLRLLWDKAKDFLTRAFTVIFVASIAIWFLQNFDVHLSMSDIPDESILALVAGWIAPIFKPLGFGNWQITTALISGFMAKESVVSTLSILFGSTAALQKVLTPIAAMALLVFCLLYTPCVAAVASIKRELGGKWATIIVIFQCVVAWIAAFIVRVIGWMFGIV